jgi:hypothetical protein
MGPPTVRGWQNGIIVLGFECALIRLRERKRVREYKQTDRYLIQILGAVFECV